jgi:hypothetical protein
MFRSALYNPSHCRCGVSQERTLWHWRHIIVIQNAHPIANLWHAGREESNEASKFI